MKKKMTVKIKLEYLEAALSIPEDGIVDVEPHKDGYLYKNIFITADQIDYIIVDGIPELEHDVWSK